MASELGHTGISSEPPSNAEIIGEKNQARAKILSAMQRILLGHPRVVQPGSTSISHLAEEAGIGRHHLYQGSADLRHRFEYLRDRHIQPTEKELNLQASLDQSTSEVGRLRVLQSKTRREAEDWKALTELLARAINTLQEELHQEQIKATRLTRRIRRLEEKYDVPSPVILMHRRQDGGGSP